ncbi:hypothetical protein DFH06DRAFT_1298380 [Mycena polygramma]|nr:hypothetical protein DFH06DRAFT_1298380 [Mycena polygramma]
MASLKSLYSLLCHPTFVPRPPEPSKNSVIWVEAREGGSCLHVPQRALHSGYLEAASLGLRCAVPPRRLTVPTANRAPGTQGCTHAACTLAAAGAAVRIVDGGKEVAGEAMGQRGPAQCFSRKLERKYAIHLFRADWLLALHREHISHDGDSGIIRLVDLILALPQLDSCMGRYIVAGPQLATSNTSWQTVVTDTSKGVE